MKRNVGWHLSTGKFILLVTLINLILYHLPLFSYATRNLDYVSLNGVLTLFVLGLIIALVSALIFFLLAFISPLLLKGFSILLVFSNAIALYFVNTYHVVLDKSMMGNVFNTRSVESLSYLHPKILVYLLIFGMIPAWFIFKIKITKTPRFTIIKQAAIMVFVGLGFIYANASTSLWFDHHARRLGGVIMPWSYLINTARFQSEQLNASKKQQLLPPANFSNNDKTLVILVIGESSRAKNFSLYGYQKNTNPLLAKAGVISLKNSTACSTYTTASVHCILSSLGEDSDSFEPLPSYLQRSGVDVTWRTNNWGEPPIKVNHYEESDDLEAACNAQKGEECDYDGIMLTGLNERIQTSAQNKIFIVLHMTGSHGPAYYKKYPSAFEVFKPVCKSVELDKCTEQELINAYDNTVLYTDHFLNQVIEILKQQQDRQTAMIYISDHGESLGEYGLYLHGTPYTIAPDVQKNVPFIVWLSPQFKVQKGLKDSVFEQQTAYSQKNVFHTVLGAFGIQSEAYKAEWDIFSRDVLKQ